MSETVLHAANDKVVWIIAIAIVVIVLVQSLLYIRLAFSTAGRIGFPREKCRKGLRAGMISAIGPSIAVFIVMVGMMSVVGSPITWLRLSIIGAAPTELTAATVGAEALGVKFGSADYDLMALATSWWTMAINGTGWLLVTALFTHKLEDVREKIGGGDSRWLAVVSGASRNAGESQWPELTALQKSITWRSRRKQRCVPCRATQPRFAKGSFGSPSWLRRGSKTSQPSSRYTRPVSAGLERSAPRRCQR